MEYVHQGQGYVPGYVPDLKRKARIVDAQRYGWVEYALSFDSSSFQAFIYIEPGSISSVSSVSSVSCIGYVEYSQFRASVEVDSLPCIYCIVPRPLGCIS